MPQPWPRDTTGTQAACFACLGGGTRGGEGHGKALRGLSQVGQAHQDIGGQLPGASARPASAPGGSVKLRAAGLCLWACTVRGTDEGRPPPTRQWLGVSALTLSLDGSTVDGHVGVPGSVPRAQDLSAQAPGDPRELGGVQVEGLSCLHGKLGAPAAPGREAVGALRKGARGPDTAP